MQQQAAKIYQLDHYQATAEAKPDKMQLILNTLVAISSNIIIGICFALLCVPAILAIFFVGGTLAILTAVSIIAVTIALLRDRAKPKKK